MFGHVTKYLTAHHLDELTPAERARVETHIAKCDSCRHEYERIRDVIALTRSFVETGPVAEAGLGRVGRRNNVRLPIWAAAAAGLVLMVGIYTWYQLRLPSWEVHSANGSVSRLRVGQWLETASETTVHVTGIGEVHVEPNSKVRMLESKPEDHRMQLERGTLHAIVWAPPRLFFVETPSATAIDLGCAYTLSVDDSGSSVLNVTTGLVELASAGRSSTVRAGWSAKTRRNRGPGTPYTNESSPAFRQALDVIDFDSSVSAKAAALDVIVKKSGMSDLATLWHLLARVDAASRERIYEKMLQLSDPPAGVTAEGVAGLNPEMMSRWKAQLGLVW